MDQPPCGRWRWLDQPPVSESLSILPVPENPITPMPYLTAVRALSCGDESYAVIVSSREEFSNWLQNPEPGAELLEVVGLINDPEVWALAAQGTMPIPLDVILEDPAADFSSLYRLVDVRNTRPVRVTIPARPGFKKALRLAVSLQLPVRILPGQPDAGVLTELAEAADVIAVLGGDGTMLNAMARFGGTAKPTVFVKAQARGLVVSRMAGKPCSNSQPAIFWRAGVLERPNTVPNAHKVRP